MPATVAVARFGLPPAGRDRRGRLHDHDAARSAVPGAAVLRPAADGGVAGDPRPCRQPQTGPASDAARRSGGDLPATEHEHAGGGPQDLPLPAGWAFDRRVNQVWCSDVTYIPMAKGFLYLVVIMDWVSRAVLAWRLSNTLGAEFCVEALEEALSQYDRPEIFNTDQSLPSRKRGAASSPATISPTP